jgi:hypothetical protein
MLMTPTSAPQPRYVEKLMAGRQMAHRYCQSRQKVPEQSNVYDERESEADAAHWIGRLAECEFGADG